MSILIYPTYLPNIWTMAAFLQADELVLEQHGNYQKQTYRNRTIIYGANGKQSLTIPVNFTHNNRQLYSEVLISGRTSWQLNHWRSLQSAYNTSAYFEFYKDRFEAFYLRQFGSIMDVSMASIELICSCLEIELSWKWSDRYDKNPRGSDLRFLVNSRKEKLPETHTYFQVFSEKHGFLSNLSTIDLIFNEGPNALPYLLAQDIKLLTIK